MENENQHCGSLSFRVTPSDTIDEVEDGFGNRGYAVTIREPHRQVQMSAEGLVRVRMGEIREDCHPMYRFPSLHTMPEDNIRAFLSDAQRYYGSEFRDMAGYRALMGYLYSRFTYEPGITTTKTTAAAALAGGHGVCQDYAHILISLMRLQGVPARYTAGMMIGEGASHAWVEVWHNGAWIGLDPTNNQMVDDTYIKLTHGRDFEDGTLDRGCFLGFASQNEIIHVKVEERS
ncbi:MAG: transglutaminase family protein [Clostridiales bacterium]|nr:transglutaminase family protein [Clostridiales bacterium]